LFLTAQFLIYPWFIFYFYVGEQTQTSLGQLSNDTTYDVYSSKVVKMC